MRVLKRKSVGCISSLIIPKIFFLRKISLMFLIKLMKNEKYVLRLHIELIDENKKMPEIRLRI